jgi:4-amino-4-deoxy-L-arabinose transferase-like glycosyltransferase
MTVLDAAAVVFLLTGVALLFVAELGRGPRVRGVQRVLLTLWILSGVGFVARAVGVLEPILRWLRT